MELFPACDADHLPSIAERKTGPASNWRGRDEQVRLDQAALARRIRRRRSEARSSSFRPPQVPYFSGLLSA